MIPLFKVAMQAEEATEQLKAVLSSGYIGQGPKVDLFEEKLKELWGCERPVLTVNSCTSALELALHLIDVKDKYVISTPQTCTATNTAIIARGGKIIWADVHPQTGNITAGSIARIIESIEEPESIAAIVCVDWSGTPCDYTAIRLAAQGIPVIEDAAHSLMSKYNGSHISNSGGDYVCFSFQAIKHLTTGDGGAIVVPPEQAKRAELLRWYGLDRKSSASFRCSQVIGESGYKFHMNDIAATIGLANLPHVQEWIQVAKNNARFYSEAINADAQSPVLYVPEYDDNSSYWLFTILVNNRDEFMSYMKAKGIDTSPVHDRNDKHFCFPPKSEFSTGIDHFAKHCISIPNGWWVTPKDAVYIAECINRFS